MKTFTRRLALTALVLSLSATALRADSSLDHAREAQALLGPDVWSEVIRIENDSPSARYTRVVYALVFELADILWFYTDSEGTQSFSLYKGRLAEDKANFTPLLAALDPGFHHWRVVPGAVAAPARGGPLPNGCLIESVVALRDRLLRGGEAVHPQLLSYYVETRNGLHGHTVLAYEAGGKIEVIDAARSSKRFTFPVAMGGDALRLARGVQGSAVAKARMLPVDWPSARSGYYSNASAARAAMANSG